jgi:hypothetical protein
MADEFWLMSSGDKVRFLRPRSPSILGQGARPPAGPCRSPRAAPRAAHGGRRAPRGGHSTMACVSRAVAYENNCPSQHFTRLGNSR